MKRKLILYITGGAILVFLLWRIFMLVFRDASTSARRFDRPPVAVEVDSVHYTSIQETRQLTGTIYPFYQYLIAPKVSGRITKINKRIGDWVNQNEVVARIDDAEYQQAVLEAEANLKISQANLTETEIQFELARQDLERVQSLQQKGIASPAELDAATTNFNALQSRIKLAQAQVEQRQAALNSANIRLSYTVLKATEPGFVGERFVDEGSLLTPNAPVISVIGINRVIVRTTVIERVYGQITVGQTARLEVDAYPGKIFLGRVSRIAPMLQEASRVAQMEIEVSNDSLWLKPGMFAKVTVVLEEKNIAQVIPSQALVSREGNSGVFIIRPGEVVAHFIPVQVGLSTQTNAEILTPRIEGVVVTLGQHLLEEGSHVILPDH
jgi:RND family efflux transporter MFP subunit